MIYEMWLQTSKSVLIALNNMAEQTNMILEKVIQTKYSII